MDPGAQKTESYFRELRLFLEEICCNLCRFHHHHQDGVLPEQIKINQEVYLGVPGAFADIKVQVPGSPAYFVEVKYGYPRQTLLTSLRRKYSQHTPELDQASKVVLVIDAHRFDHWAEVEADIRSHLKNTLQLEIWPEEELFARIQETFDVKIDTISEDTMLDLRDAIDKAKGVYAFGEAWTNDTLQSSLIWHFGFWRLRQLRDVYGLTPRAMMPPGLYRNAVVVMADLSAFSSYVRDTRDDAVVRHCLTAYYSKARYEIMNTGGMLYQFVGDEVSGLFGVPRPTADYLRAALACARALLDIGNSISHEWQRQIDRVQSAKGVHIGIAMGEVQFVSLRPYGRAHLGAVSDAINMAARLLQAASAGEIAVSNTYYQGLDETSQGDFVELEDIEARNLGRINAWKWHYKQ
jgi:class 3 adenylate cyclase